jgi:hypothetical protein
MLTILALSLSAAAAEPATVPGGLFDADSLHVAADGTVHALVAPKQVRLSKLTTQIAFTNEDGDVIGRVGGPPVRHLAVAPDGTVAVTPIPGPVRGEWTPELKVDDAALALRPDGAPVIVVLGRVCYEKQPCVGQLWVAEPGDEGFVTRELPSAAGAYRGLAVRADAGGYVAVSHLTAPDFVGFVAWDDGSERRWFSGRGDPVSLVDRGGQLALVYRDGDELHISDGTADEPLATDARHGADALVLPDGTVQYSLYDANTKRLRGGLAGSPAAEIDGPESGWFNALALAGEQPVAAWYYYRNNYNKGVRLGVRDGATWDRWTQIRSATDNVGWGLDLAAGADGSLALLALDRSHHRVVLHRWPTLEAARAEAVADAGDWTDRRRSAFFFAYGGGWYQLWGIDARAPSEEDFTFNADVAPQTGTYGVQPGLGLEGGFAGKIGPVDLVLEYMRRNDQDEAFQTIDRLQNLVGKLGIEDLPMPDSELQLHLRTSDLSGAYLDTDATVRPFTTGERLVELRYVGKQGYHFGLRYHGFAGPTDVFLSRDRAVFDRFVADGRFTTGSFVAGWAVMDYLKKYEVRFFGPYLDAQVGVGYANAALTPAGDAAVATPFTASGFTFTGNGDLGLAAYRRVRSLQGLGGFVRVGVRGWLQVTGNSEPEDDADTTTTSTGTPEEPPPFPNFMRTDRRAGPYANVGVVF